jgi:hypothetical protein
MQSDALNKPIPEPRKGSQGRGAKRGGFRGKSQNNRGQYSRGRGNGSYQGYRAHSNTNGHNNNNTNSNLPTLKREKNTIQQRLEDELLSVDSESDITPVGSVNSDSFEEVGYL